MKNYSLNGNWDLYFFKQGSMNIKTPEDLKGSDVPKILAEVPGNVELDLSKAGYLPQDLYMGMNIEKVQDYELHEWWYEREFDAPELDDKEKAFLKFDGVDCFAEYFVNGEKIGESKNALIEHEFEVTDVLKSGKNTLTVRISSPIIEAWNTKPEIYTLANTAGGRNVEYSYIRKAPHCFGWDIMPRALGSGIWRSVNLVVKGEFEVDTLYCYTYAIEGGTRVIVCYDLIAPPSKNMEVEIIGKCGDSEFYGRKKMEFKAGAITVPVENPKLWWPYGYGDANLYDLTAHFYKDGELIATKTIKTGIRTVELVRTDTTDGKNGCFKFLINDVEIMAKGTNWVPMDVFHSRDAGRYDKALELVRDIGCNIIRCWGGNVYEDHQFFDFCDANGIMVWQDFAMACNMYPQDDEFQKVMAEEATAVVKKLRNHPSIILWSGDNECDIRPYFSNYSTNDNKVTREVFPWAVRKNDVKRPYLASSPYIPEEISMSKDNGDIIKLSEEHLWGPRDYFKSSYYTSSKAHFVSEQGYHGCPSPESLAMFIDKDHLWPNTNNEQWTLHSTDTRGDDSRVKLVTNQIKQLFGAVPENIDDYTFASQISQAEAKKFFIERMRTDRPYKTGIIWWNLLDGWPQISDAVVGYYYDKKIAYDYIKRSQEPVALMFRELESWNLTLVCANDTLKPVKGTYTVKNMDTNEVVLEGSFDAKPNGICDLQKVPVMYSDKGMFLIEWYIDGERYFNHYMYGYPGFDLDDYKRWYKLIK
ncbi:MAG: glycoside hydrolase family 2 [Clostridia bacterium]|nr:glycoside hydrolase family 2 [Clostridia bacterium]